MSHGTLAAPAAGAAGGVGVTPEHMFEAEQVIAPPASVSSFDLTVQVNDPRPTIATSEICFQTYVVLIKESPPCARLTTCLSRAAWSCHGNASAPESGSAAQIP